MQSHCRRSYLQRGKPDGGLLGSVTMGLFAFTLFWRMQEQGMGRTVTQNLVLFDDVHA